MTLKEKKVQIALGTYLPYIWKERKKLRDEGYELIDGGDKLIDKGNKLIAEGSKLSDKVRESRGEKYIFTAEGSKIRAK